MNKILPFALLAAAISCKHKQLDSSEAKVDASNGIIYDLQIDAGVVLARKSEPKEKYEDIIRGQLSYTIATLQAYESGSDFWRAKVEQLSAKPYEKDAEFVEIRYRTTLTLVWSKTTAPPEPKFVTFFLPAVLDDSYSGSINPRYSKSFYDAFSDKCSDPITETVDGKTVTLPKKPDHKFANYLQPLFKDCPFRDLMTTAKPQEENIIMTLPGYEEPVAFVVGRVEPSLKATIGMKPEYDQIWKDGRLTVTMLTSPYEAMTADDISIINRVKRTLDTFVKAYGRPAANIDLSGAWPDVWKRILDSDGHVHAVFDSPKGPVVLDLLVADEIPSAESGDAAKKMREKLLELSADADLYSYSGHAGVGVNIRAFVDAVAPKQGKYQIVWLQSCNSFTYVDERLQEHAKATNPGFGPFKYLDVISNAQYSWAESPKPAVRSIADALIGGKLTYREILASLEQWNNPVVFGEEDNGKPFPD